MTAVQDRTPMPSADLKATGLSHVVASEWMKLRTVRSTFWTLVTMFVGSTVISFLICLAAAGSMQTNKAEGHPDSGDIVLFGLAFVGQIAAYVLGVMTISAEYSTGGIRTTLTAVPRRTEILVAKALLLAATVFVVGLVTAFACYFAGNAVLNAKDVGNSLSDPGVMRGVIGSGLYLAGLSVFGLAMGFLLRHTAGAITIGLALIFVIGNLVGLIPGSIGAWIYKVMPSIAGGQITQFGPQGTSTRATEVLSPWAGFGVFCVEVVALLVIGGLFFEKRDA